MLPNYFSNYEPNEIWEYASKIANKPFGTGYIYR